MNDDRPVFVPPPPDPELRVVVIIPARNEVDRLPDSLGRFTDQQDLRGQPLDRRQFELIVLANNCTDGSSEVARGFARDSAPGLAVHVVEHDFRPENAHVGTARKWLMDQACQRLEAVGKPGGLIASTDADTVVGHRWVAASLAEAAAGADAVAGIINVDARELKRLGPRVRRGYWLDRIHRRLQLELEALLDPNPLDPGPRHDFHGGASFAITPSMYRQVGGLPPRPSGEDVALAEALWRVDARFVHSLQVRVRTSTRQVGRATGGQSHELARWSHDPPTLVPHPQHVESDLRLRRRLRGVFLAKRRDDSPRWRPDPAELNRLARNLGLKSAALEDLMTGQTTFGAWLEGLASRRKVEKRGYDQPSEVPIEEAITQFRDRVRAVRKADRG